MWKQPNTKDRSEMINGKVRNDAGAQEPGNPSVLHRPPEYTNELASVVKIIALQLSSVWVYRF